MRVETIRNAAPRIVAVNHSIIANADIAREVQNHQGASPIIAWEAATRALVVRELLSQRAQALDLVAEPRSENGLRETDEEALIRMLLEAEVKTPSAEDADCRRYYQSNLARFRSPDLYEPLHILFKATRADKPAYAQAVTRPRSSWRKSRPSPSASRASPRRCRPAHPPPTVAGLGRSRAAIRHRSSKPPCCRWKRARSAHRWCARATACMCCGWIANRLAPCCRSRRFATVSPPTWRRVPRAGRPRSI
jgi:hypothetical protein